MAGAHPSDQVVSEHLAKILGSTRLSMDQVAKKWHVSCAMLSQIKNVLEEQKRNKLEGTFNGELSYDVSDIDEEGLEKLIKVNLEYQNQTRKILKEHRKHRLKGGIRVFTQSLVSTMKKQITLMSLLVTFTIFFSNGVFAQGVGGNVSGNGGKGAMVLQGVELPGVSSRTQRIELSRFKTLTLKGHSATIGRKELRFKKAVLVTENFPSKEEAIEGAKIKQLEIATDFSYQKAKAEFGRFNRECFEGSKRLGYDDPHFFRFRGFEVIETFHVDGTPRYKAKISIDFLCEVD